MAAAAEEGAAAAGAVAEEVAAEGGADKIGDPCGSSRRWGTASRRGSGVFGFETGSQNMGQVINNSGGHAFVGPAFVTLLLHPLVGQLFSGMIGKWE